MTKVIKTEVDSNLFSSGSILKVGIVGAIIGLLYWFFVGLVDYYADSIAQSGGVASIIVAVIGLLIMARMRIAHSLIIVIASALSLWGLALWTNGLLWWEMALFSAILYAISYVLYSWIVRIKQVSVSLLVVAVVVIAVQIIANL